jgi:hypothetical protein
MGFCHSLCTALIKAGRFDPFLPRIRPRAEQGRQDQQGAEEGHRQGNRQHRAHRRSAGMVREGEKDDGATMTCLDSSIDVSR